ncbi:DUF542 domain-containing protein [Halomonas sp. WWR20]
MTLLDCPVGQLARRQPGATRVFHDDGIDFCFGGYTPVRDSLAKPNRPEHGRTQ